MWGLGCIVRTPFQFAFPQVWDVAMQRAVGRPSQLPCFRPSIQGSIPVMNQASAASKGRWVSAVPALGLQTGLQHTAKIPTGEMETDSGEQPVEIFLKERALQRLPRFDFVTLERNTKLGSTVFCLFSLLCMGGDTAASQPQSQRN